MDKVAQIKKDYPNIKITILTGSSGKELIQLLENHKIDFALDSTTMQIKNKDIKKETIKEIENIFISKEQLLIDNLKNLENQRLILNRTFRITHKDFERGEIVTFEAPTKQYSKWEADQSNPIAIYEDEPKGLISKFIYYSLEVTKKSYIKRKELTKRRKILLKKRQIFY